MDCDLTIGTGIGAAVINFLFAVEAGVGNWAEAAVSTIWVICASASIEAWSIGTSHGAELTVFTIESRWAGAGIAIFQVLLKEKGKGQSL